MAARSICLMSYGKTPCGAARATARTPAPHRLAASLHCGCTLRRVRCSQLQRLRSPSERLRDYWTREIHPPAAWEEILRTLERAWWLGELRGNSGPTRFNVSKTCSPRCAIETTWGSHSLWAIVQAATDRTPDGLPESIFAIKSVYHLTTQKAGMKLPVRTRSTRWQEVAEVAEVTEKSSIDSYREFAILLPSIKLRSYRMQTPDSCKGITVLLLFLLLLLTANASISIPTLCVAGWYTDLQRRSTSRKFRPVIRLGVVLHHHPQ